MKRPKKWILTGAFLFLSLLTYPQDYFLNSEGKPSEKGIEYYSVTNLSKIKEDFIKKLNISKINLDTTYLGFDEIIENNQEENSAVLGELANYREGTITIDLGEHFFAYSNNNLPKNLEGKIIDCDAFLRGAIIHELGHQYVDDFKYYNSIPDNSVVVSVSEKKENFVEIFIEEGIAQYCVKKMNELIYSKNFKIPKTIDELLSKDTESAYFIKYRYSLYFVEPVFKKLGFEEGVKTLIEDPPAIQELLNRKEYYKRILK